MHVTVLLGDPRLPDPYIPGGRFTSKDLDEIRRLKMALGEIADHTFEFCDDHTRMLDDLRDRRPEFVLNFCDNGFRNEARHELHVAALLEMLAIPYSGCGPVALALCYDKALVRAVAAAHGVAVPAEVFLRPGDPMPSLTYPAFLKPNRGDGSVGITADSLVHNAAEARAYLDRLRRETAGDVIAQEFLSGTEYSVGMVGNRKDGFTVLPLLEVDYGTLDPSLPRLRGYGCKTDPNSCYRAGVRFREARLTAERRAGIIEWCWVLFERLQLRDYARLDFRADARGEVKLMEVNPNPGWSPGGLLNRMARTMGEEYSWLLERILEAALRRCFGLAEARSR